VPQIPALIRLPAYMLDGLVTFATFQLEMQASGTLGSGTNVSPTCGHRGAAFAPLHCRSFHSSRRIPTSSAQSHRSGLKAALLRTDNLGMHRSGTGALTPPPERGRSPPAARLLVEEIWRIPESSPEKPLRTGTVRGPARRCARGDPLLAVGYLTSN